MGPLKQADILNTYVANRACTRTMGFLPLSPGMAPKMLAIGQRRAARETQVAARTPTHRPLRYDGGRVGVGRGSTEAGMSLASRLRQVVTQMKPDRTHQLSCSIPCSPKDESNCVSPSEMTPCVIPVDLPRSCK